MPCIAVPNNTGQYLLPRSCSSNHHTGSMVKVETVPAWLVRADTKFRLLELAVVNAGGVERFEGNGAWLPSSTTCD